MKINHGISLRPMTNLVLPDSCLAVFVDDTGHEALVEGQPVYGLEQNPIILYRPDNRRI